MTWVAGVDDAASAAALSATLPPTPPREDGDLEAAPDKSSPAAVDDVDDAELLSVL
jgi:hypothetical protein